MEAPQVKLSGHHSNGLIEVTAPNNLPGGYHLEVTIPESNRVVTVTVPEGGVLSGDTFMAKLESTSTSSTAPSINIVVGNWKDGICDCFKYGCCHPMLWNSLCCPLIATGQIMTRLDLRWYGIPGPVDDVARTFSTTVGITIFTMVFNWLLVTIMLNEIDYENGAYEDTVTVSELYVFAFWLRRLINFWYALTLIFVVTMTRGYIRNRYSIPGSEVQDCCLSFWCTCCTVSQMARHTTDYDVYPGKLCTPTGLSADAPTLDSMAADRATPVVEATVV